MPGFFTVTDIPSRRVVQYRRTSATDPTAVYLLDEKPLGAAVDTMPFADKTGIAAGVTGTLYEVPYLPDVGGVYFATQPMDSVVGSTLRVEARAGEAPYVYQWYKDDRQVVSIPESADGSLLAAAAGRYFCVVTDTTGNTAVSSAFDVTEPEV
ncbi:hypothetical protein [Serratia nevei]|uniref:immunoglobulin domain-containing protein n=1 Tax=Serratia nevei TaxID=2703794 RepID=UPI00313C065D